MNANVTKERKKRIIKCERAKGRRERETTEVEGKRSESVCAAK
jgi:hypothetical protein